MDSFLNIQEALNIAVAIEKNGADFYMKVAQKSADPGIKELLERFAAMEIAHEKRFSSMLADVSKDLTANDDDLQAESFLKAVAQGKVFSLSDDPDDLKDASIQDIFSYAIQKEKDSIVFYEGLKLSSSLLARKPEIDKIISEELGHITDLISLRESMN